MAYEPDDGSMAFAPAVDGCRCPAMESTYGGLNPLARLGYRPIDTWQNPVLCRITWNTLLVCYGNARDLDGAYRSAHALEPKE